jgi:hypothetical protein
VALSSSVSATEMQVDHRNSCNANEVVFRDVNQARMVTYLRMKFGPIFSPDPSAL